ncbi:PLP-dependent aminotransferase family protein [Streptomyces sp. NPDC059851]|uniref:aminotransferase-like domain-containing protein n=1 Tax=Streptomyces sp. NPDC059851 TaxID=3346971 RepID=UPI0036467B2E
MEDFRLIADEIAASIAAGRLRPGEQLPTQRAFARRRRIAPSTAARVYAELVRRSLVVGEVGRGTFVRAGGDASLRGVPLAEPAAARVDLELNYPVVPEQAEVLGSALAPMLRTDALDAALRPVGARGTPTARRAFASLVASGADGGAAWQPAEDEVLFAGNGRQAIAASLAALVPPGRRLGVEELTYPVVKAIAQRLGITLVPLPTDEHGLLPDALGAVHRATPLNAVYAQPRLHNPLGTSLAPERREALAAALRTLDLTLVEDAVWSFLQPAVPPLAALAPERTIVVDSLSKRLAPGLSTGFLVVPDALRAAVGASLRSTGGNPSGFALEAAVRWIGDGTVSAIGAAKRADAVQRQALARRILAGQRLLADTCSYYTWWHLPPQWRAETFVAAAAREGIALTPGAAFAVGPGASPSAVRIGLASPPLPVLERALRLLGELADAAPEDLLG